MDILVTGASGFIGSRLVERLIEEGHTVSTFGRHPANEEQLALKINAHFQGDICQPGALAPAVKGKDVVYHLAGLVSYRRADCDKLFAVNVQGARNVMQSCLEAGVSRVIHLGSIAGMGIPKESELGNEDIEYNLKGLGLYYCDSKYEGEKEVFKFVSKGLPVLSLNPGITLGKGDTHPHHHTIFRSLAGGWLLGYPSGGVMFSDLEDVVDSCLSALTKGQIGQRYVLGSANMTFHDAACLMAEIASGRKPIFQIPGWLSEGAGVLCESIFPLFGKKPVLSWQVAWLSQREIFFSSDKANKELGHKQTSFADTLKRTMPFYLQKEPQLEPIKLSIPDTAPESKTEPEAKVEAEAKAEEKSETEAVEKIQE